MNKPRHSQSFYLLVFFFALIQIIFLLPHLTAQDRPNVLFIAVDDLNDWIGTLGGHPDVKTPYIDALADQGVLFTNAYCPAPACNPSRAAVMTGIRPSTSGVYHNPQPWRKSPELEYARTIPEYFRQYGYKVLGSGKIFHGRYPDPASWDEYWPSKEQQRPEGADAPESLKPLNGIPETRHFDWGPIDVNKDEMSDSKVAEWVSKQLSREHEKPFFLACGFFRPHLPWYVPQAYFDQYPLSRISLPLIKEDDLGDVPEAGRQMARRKDDANVRTYKQRRQAVRAYLASISFVDECVGKVFGALQTGPHKDNTIVVLWSDHGWHLGEKLHWRKFALWEEATHSVMTISAPGITKPGGRCKSPVNLIDIYPTLLELCGLPENKVVEGNSLVPLLEKPGSKWKYGSLTTHGRNNHAVRLAHWRYIRYEDGSEELYNQVSDPHEWTNLAGLDSYQSTKKRLSKWLPEVNAEMSVRE